MTSHQGLNRQSGARIRDAAHLAQSIADILFTPVGTRVMRRDYGSRLTDLIDAPINPETAVELVAATAEALDRWEPRVVVRRVEIGEASTAGRLTLALVIEPRTAPTGPTRIEVSGP